ncbi:MAG: hypothetical protein JZU53_14355 [Paludibacter sp.]|nr:hypothetical protein [Paludibacter sp.]
MNSNLKSIFLSAFIFISIFTLQAQKVQKLDDNTLCQQFTNPPTAAKPYVWWHWMGSNFSKSGITKDLEAMKEMGIGGATIFNLSSAVQESHAPTQNNPWPEQTYRSPAYWEALRFAASEAQRLGLEIGLHNTVGYSTTGGPWIDESRSMQQLVWSDTTIVGNDNKAPIQLNAPKLIANEGWGATGRKISFYKDLMVLAIPADKSDLSIVNVLNLTAQYDPIKGLQWKIPKGEKWIIYRMGHASTGRPPHPVPDDLIGKTLEADKMSVEQTVFHWNTVLDPVKQYLGAYLGKSFKHMLIDSYEAGNQTWTPNFTAEFIKLKGYDPTPWLLTFCKTITNYSKTTLPRTLGTVDQTKRFEWDYNDVINTLFMNNGFKVGKRMLNDSKLSLQWEPYGGPFNIQQGVAISDLPMGEFWSTSNGMIDATISAAARASGKTIVGAEAFTGRPEVSKYTEDPAMLKHSANGAFASGVNRLILHHWVHQPFDDKYQPGMGMGWWGTHFGRYQTWAQSGKAFFDYLARCQALLQQGEGVADYLCVENLTGYADVFSINDFLSSEIVVKDGKIVLPSGRVYPFIVFINSVMLPEVAKKIKNLVADGATIVSPKPTQSPSLANYPACDDALKLIGAVVWGNNSSNSYGRGFVFTKLDDAKMKYNITPDFVVENAEKADDIKLNHRHTENADIYYVANMSKTSQDISVSFRIAGKQPELWQAEDGSMRKAAVWIEKEGRTSVNLKLRGLQTVFVVFQKLTDVTDHLVDVKTEKTTANYCITTDNNGIASVRSTDTISAIATYASGKQKTINIKPTISKVVEGEWNVAFVPKLGMPFQRKFPELVDFSKHTDKEIMYFAGTATYTKTVKISKKEFTIGKRILLDLGEMNDLAQVKINGLDKGTLWYPPFKVDITDALKNGDNIIEIAVTNNWANRLIGDEKEPADFDWGTDRGVDRGHAMKAYPDWFLKNEKRPSQGRKAFTVWYYYRDNSPLQPAGLVGPVKLVSMGEVKL